MLVLSRKPGERIVIETPDGTVVEILVGRAMPSGVKLIIDAPKSFRILRGELFDRDATEAGR